ncbi:helix-turn-helix transcriptional regulator [Streptomyces sp. MnatMP-M17]|uniref:ArsR/SmtB family transcription factor n=1 Tax=unclassified Streptomyces TaxID=2593676 RepID=UPI00081F1D40|nr:helix-turn-helix transcriptional regulator [Streptomyces sp. MnatMP-M17]MYZ40118.1 helix-turn-helix domain-containing protein [Streptomyces sp. SID4917]SCG06663.1 transcriptional regulator, ArsR family [Streptomyces sp. MnatMP-M17]
MRTLKHPTREEIQLTDVFHALSDPTRLAIVRGLDGVTEQSCSSLNIPLSKSTLSHHLKVLRDSGVTHTRAEGTHRLMSLRRQDLEARFPGLLDVVLRTEPVAAA